MQVTTPLKWATPTRQSHREQRKPRLFIRFGKEEALTRIRSMLDEPTLCYQTIAQHFGVTRQRIAQIAADMGVNGRRRQRERKLLTPVVQHEPNYPANVRCVIQKLKRTGLEVAPSSPTAKQTLLVNGVLCRVYCRKAAIWTGRTGREYVRFEVGKRAMAVKVALFAFWRDRRLKLYVFSVRELQTISAIWIPYNGRYAGGNNRKPKRDWIAYEEAWDKFEELTKLRSGSSGPDCRGLYDLSTTHPKKN